MLTMPTTTADDLRTAIPTSPPANWQREVPRYRIVRAVHPSPKPRARTEPPFSSSSDQDMWQYSDRVYQAGEVVETTEWPHASFFPLNFVAKRIVEYFNSRQKSRLARSPYDARGQLQLSDGLSGALPQIRAPQMPPVGMQSAGGWPRR
jgi:hypothetical protein